MKGKRKRQPISKHLASLPGHPAKAFPKSSFSLPSMLSESQQCIAMATP